MGFPAPIRRTALRGRRPRRAARRSISIGGSREPCHAVPKSLRSGTLLLWETPLLRAGLDSDFQGAGVCRTGLSRWTKLSCDTEHLSRAHGSSLKVTGGPRRSREVTVKPRGARCWLNRRVAEADNSAEAQNRAKIAEAQGAAPQLGATRSTLRSIPGADSGEFRSGPPLKTAHPALMSRHRRADGAGTGATAGRAALLGVCAHAVARACERADIGPLIYESIHPVSESNRGICARPGPGAARESALCPVRLQRMDCTTWIAWIAN